jgi:catechol 2,3-dioxygenase-like lactoylglutathione lyase family enzyme
MSNHHVVTIVPCGDINASEAFYRRLGCEVESDYGNYRILSDGKGWHLHLNEVKGWPANIEDNPIGLYLYTDEVDAVAERVRELIIEPGTPNRKPWGTYEFAVSDPSGVLVRIGNIVE